MKMAGIVHCSNAIELACGDYKSRAIEDRA